MNKIKAAEAEGKKFSDNSVPEEEARIVGIIQQEGKLSAVKWYREKHGCELKEAKDVIDAIAAKNSSSIQPAGGRGCLLIVLIGIGVALGAAVAL